MSTFWNEMLPAPTLECLLHGMAAYAPGALLGPAEWRHFDLLIVPRGAARLEVRGEGVDCVAGTAVLIPPRHPFHGRAGSDGCTLWVQHFRPVGQWRNGRPLRRPIVWQRGASGTWPQELMRHIGHCQHPDKAPASARVRAALALSMLLDALREHPAPDPAHPAANRVLELLDRRNHPLPDIPGLAAEINISESQLRSVFRRATGRSLGIHLRECRMNEAARLLRETGLPVKAIAARLGYSATESFHRAFLAFHGTSPAAFRAKYPKLV